MNMTGVKLKEKSSFGSLALKILGFIAQLAERPAVNRKAAGSIPAVPAQKTFSMELRPMAGQLSDAQPMWVRFPQLRSCFSGAMEAQLFRNQQAVGSNPTGSSHIYVPVG